LAEPQLAASWARIRGRLRDEVGEVQYRSWLRQMTLAGLDGDEAVILLPTRFLRDWVRSHYGDRLRALWQGEVPAVRRLEFRVMPEGHAEAEVAPVLTEAGTANGEAALAPVRPPIREAAGLAEPLGRAADPRAEARNDWSAPLDPRFTFDTFVVGKPNEFAHACARRVAERPASPGFNPLFLYGGVGLGKTHLMHAVAWASREHGAQHGRAMQVAYMSAEKFMYRFIAALRRQSDDGVQGKPAQRRRAADRRPAVPDRQGQHAGGVLPHLQRAGGCGKQIVVSSDKPPSDLAGIEDRLRTRLGCGMVADLHATTYELRISILQAKAQARASRCRRRCWSSWPQDHHQRPELEGALNRLIAHANLFGRPGDAGRRAGGAARRAARA
jgi:chromosomal replication initiator protein